VEITTEALEKLVTDASAKGAEAAVRAINTPDPAARPAAAVTAPNVNLKRPVMPSLGKAIFAARYGNWKGAELERDFSQASNELLLGGEGAPDSVIIPMNKYGYAEVLDQAAIRTSGREALGDYAVRALSESIGGVNSVTYGNTVGAALVPPQFLQELFQLTLTQTVVMRSMPEVTTIPVTSNIVELPRESTVATATSIAEAAALSSSDPAFATQAFTIQKQYGYRTYSNELLRDSNPTIDAYIVKTLARDVALFQDLQYLEGSGSGTNLTGLRNYSSLTSSSWAAATNGSTPGADDLIKMVFDIRKANAEMTAWVMHPRTLQNIVLLKDASGRYIFSDVSVWGGPIVNPQPGTDFGALWNGPTKAVGRLLGYPVYLSTQILTNETQGSSSSASHILYGAFNFAYILERQGFEIAQSEHVAFANDQTAVRGTARSAFAVTQPKAFAAATGII
jgi:HK97 family phage major capsid protein